MSRRRKRTADIRVVLPKGDASLRRLWRRVGDVSDEYNWILCAVSGPNRKVGSPTQPRRHRTRLLRMAVCPSPGPPRSSRRVWRAGMVGRSQGVVTAKVVAGGEGGLPQLLPRLDPRRVAIV